LARHPSHLSAAPGHQRSPVLNQEGVTDADVYLLDAADFDPFTGRVVLRFRGLAPIQVQATLMALHHLKAAVTESMARLGRFEKPSESAAPIW
jgi:hypothetical protein